MPYDLVVLPGAFDFCEAEVGQLTEVGEVAHETHEDAEFVGDLLVDVELHLSQPTRTSSK